MKAPRYLVDILSGTEIVLAYFIIEELAAELEGIVNRFVALRREHFPERIVSISVIYVAFIVDNKPDAS